MSPALVQATWDDAPHLSEKQKDDLWSEIPPHERDARSKGLPVLGRGKIYPVDVETVLCDPFEIPRYWPRAYGFDADWNHTAAIWGAWDREADIVYLYSEYYAGQKPPAVHAAGVKLRGEWIPGAMDPSTHGKINQSDGKVLSEEYFSLGLSLENADNTVEAGLFACYQRMETGGLRVFRTLQNWQAEIGIYRRDDKGKVIKENDHIMDAMRYLIMTGMAIAVVEPAEVEDLEQELAQHGRNEHTGY